MSTDSPKRLLCLMAAFGYLSGLPLSLTAFTLQLWFTTYGLPVHTIGQTPWLGLPYTVKFLWSGMFDRMPPGIVSHFGRRRGWLLMVQPCLCVSVFALAISDPGEALPWTLAAAFLVAFLSASQDILIDAWRIEVFAPAHQGAALAAYVWGYRGAMLTCTAGVPLISGVAGWRPALLMIGVVLGCGVCVTWLAPNPGTAASAPAGSGWRAAVEAAFWAPLRDMWRRRGAFSILAFVVLFRLGKVFADGSAASFYRYGAGFTPQAVGQAGLYGWAGLLAGAAAGAWLVARLGTRKALLAAGLAQAASLGLYLALLATGPSVVMLSIKILGENFAGSAADMAFLTYVSALCNRAFTASQYALLSSLAAVAFHTLGGLSGYAAEALGYPGFYAATIVASVPALLIMLGLRPSANESGN